MTTRKQDDQHWRVPAVSVNNMDYVSEWRWFMFTPGRGRLHRTAPTF